MRVLCVIPARGGSKGLKNKNLRKIGGVSLVGHAVRCALKSEVVDDIVVSTDSKAIARDALAHGAAVPFLRPTGLAGDLATTEATLQHAIIETEHLFQCVYDLAVFLSPSDIFRSPCWIKDAVSILEENKELESVFVGHNTHKNFWEKDDSGSWIRLRDWMSLYSSRQIRKPVVREDTGLASVSRAELWRSGRRIGDSVEILVNNDSFTGIDIHDEQDLRLARAAFKIRQLNQ